VTGVGPGTSGRGGRSAATVALLVGLALVVAGAFLPWVRSGTSSRSSFALVRSADRLGVVDDGLGEAVLRGWYLVPLLAAIVLVLIASHRPRVAAGAGLLLALVVAAVATVVLVAAPTTGPGPIVCVVGAAVTVAGSGAALRARPPRRRPPEPGPG
jgi:hypothetical protein